MISPSFFFLQWNIEEEKKRKGLEPMNQIQPTILPNTENTFRVLTQQKYEELKGLQRFNQKLKYDLKQAEDLSCQTSRIIGNHDAATYFGNPEEVVTMNKLQDGVEFAENFDETTQREKVDIYNQDVDYDQLDRDTQSDDGDSRYYHLKGGSYE